MDESILTNFIELLVKNDFKLAVAESCTGGLISSKITDIPGISEFFDRGFVTYSNISKVKMLGVNENTIKIYGAVSRETAIEMARGVLINSSADISVAVTGIAGPSGGSRDKPVGTVFVAAATKERIECKKFNFSGDRRSIKEQTCEAAFKMLLYII